MCRTAAVSIVRLLALAVAGEVDAATITVPAGGSLQSALNAARPGDVIVLQAGVTYTGNFLLPNKGDINDYIVIRSGAPDSALPAPGIRMTPQYSAQLPKTRSSNTSAGNVVA